MYQFALADTRAVNEIKKDVLDATKTLPTPQRGFTPPTEARHQVDEADRQRLGCGEVQTGTDL
jgi:hypothetical protein